MAQGTLNSTKPPMDNLNWELKYSMDKTIYSTRLCVLIRPTIKFHANNFNSIWSKVHPIWSTVTQNDPYH